jgi:hypothetical protein
MAAILPVSLVRVKCLLMTVLLSLALPVPASAHLGRTRPSGYVSKVERIVSAHGVSARASANGRFSVSAPAGHEVVVNGYEGEPYVRFAGGRIYENERAPTTYINRHESPPGSARATATPRWHEIGRGLHQSWHDHRIHWMAAKAPPAIRAHPERSHHVFDWTVRATVDDAPVQIVGSLNWRSRPGAPGIEWWIALAAVSALVAYLGYYVLFRSQTSTPLVRSAR